MSINLLALCLLPAISPSAIVSRCRNCFLVDFMRLDCLFFLSSQGLAQYLAGTELKSWRAKEGTLTRESDCFLWKFHLSDRRLKFFFPPTLNS